MATLTSRDSEVIATTQEAARVKSGVAAAAFISSGIGTFVIGFLTTAAVISEGLKNFLNWYNPAGPLSGKTSVGIIVWLISWVWLNSRWKNEDYELGRAFTITLVLLVLGLVLTFPPVFEAFE